MNAHFEYCPGENRLLNDFYKYVKDAEPFQFKEKDYLNLMEIKGIDYFKVTAEHSINGKDLYFKFNVKDFEEPTGSKYHIYYYDKVYFK